VTEKERRDVTAQRTELVTSLQRTAARLDEIAKAASIRIPRELPERPSTSIRPDKVLVSAGHLDYEAAAHVYSGLAQELHRMDLSPPAPPALEVIAVSTAQRATPSTPILTLLGLVGGLIVSTLLVCAIAYIRLVT
jgi:hypothetical protein